MKGILNYVCFIGTFVQIGIISLVAYPYKQFHFNNINDIPPVSEFLHKVNRDLSSLSTFVNEMNWKFATNITQEKMAAASEANADYEQLLLGFAIKAKQYNENDPSYSDAEKRQLTMLRQAGAVPNDEAIQKRLIDLVTSMEDIYSTAKWQGMDLDPGLEGILTSSRDYQTLLDVFIGWRNVTGPLMKPLYEEFVELINQGAVDGGFNDTSEVWKTGYDMSIADFDEMCENLWEQVKPLYEQLHCYVKSRLMAQYGKDKFPESGYIPAHLLGNMWAQDWVSIMDLVAPFPDIPPLDITPELLNQNYTAQSIHKTAEAFFMSLGLDPLPNSFWEKSLLTRPQDREVVCHASAWDFGDNDLRIKMCTKINQEDFITAHHEQGHLYYDHYYANQPYLFRGGAADFFHEAIGDTVALSVVVPSHLEKIGLLQLGNATDQESLTKQVINYQMSVALSKVAFLPFGFIMDKWRWNVFAGNITPENYTSTWWEMVQQYQGLYVPVERTEQDFDPGAKYHIAANVPYMQYFLAHILQFQLHRGLCRAAGFEGPLYECDIYENSAAGKNFRNMLSLGASEPWPEVLQQAIGECKLDATAILDYFEILMNWLEEQNEGQNCGWSD